MRRAERNTDGRPNGDSSGALSGSDTGSGSGAARHAPPDLLPWQIACLAWILGLLAYAYPLPGLTGFVIYLILARLHVRADPLILTLAFVLGLAAVNLTLPEAPPDYPDWMRNVRLKVQVNGTVSEVQFTPGEGARVILADVRVGPRPGPAPEASADEDQDGPALTMDNAMSAPSESVKPKPTLSDKAKRTRKARHGEPAIPTDLDWSRLTVPAAGQALPGRLILNVTDHDRNSPPLPNPGDRLSLVAKPRPIRSFANPGLWDYAFHWARQGVFWRAYAKPGEIEAGIVSRAAPGLPLRARDALRTVFLRLVPDSDGRGVMLALLLGERQFISRPDTDRIGRAGLAHSLALSGLHVGFVAALALGLVTLAGRLRPAIYLLMPRPRLTVLVGAPLVLAYVWIGQGQVSLVRAALMFAFWGALLLAGRGRILLDGLFFALALILLADPPQVYDLSLQLSVLAVAAIALFLPQLNSHLTAWAGDSRLLRLLAAGLDLILITLIVNLTMLPLQLGYFAALTPQAWLNLLWVPALGALVMPPGLVGLALLPLPGLGEVGGWLIHLGGLVCTLLLDLLRWLDGRGQLAVLTVYRPLWPQYVGWFLLAAVAAGLWRRKGVILAGELALVLILLAGPVLWTRGETGQVRVSLSLVDVGQGQAALVETPGGGRTLIDGGGFQTGDFDVGRAILGPTLTYGRPPRLDRVLLTHTDADHLKGLRFILTQFRVGEFVWTGHEGGSTEIREILDIAHTRSVPVRTVRAGERIDLGGGVVLEVAHPPGDFSVRKNNDHSLVIRLTWDGQGLALLCGDVERQGIRSLLVSGRDVGARVLVLPHHGGKSSFSPDLYDAVRPEAVFVSSGFLNHFGMPNRTILAEMRNRRLPVFNTAESGMISAVWERPDTPPRLRGLRVASGYSDQESSVLNWLTHVMEMDKHPEMLLGERRP